MSSGVLLRTAPAPEPAPVVQVKRPRNRVATMETDGPYPTTSRVRTFGDRPTQVRIELPAVEISRDSFERTPSPVADAQSDFQRGFARGKQIAVQYIVDSGKFVPIRHLVTIGAIAAVNVALAGAPLAPLDLLMSSTPLLAFLGPVHLHASPLIQFGCSAALGALMGMCPVAYLPWVVRLATAALASYALWASQRLELAPAPSMPACSSLALPDSLVTLGGTMTLSQAAIWAAAQVPVVAVGAAVLIACAAYLGQDAVQARAKDRILLPMASN